MAHFHKNKEELCPTCGKDFYLDPKLAVAAIIPYKDKIIMVKRAIEPGIGKWSFPSGYVNRYESLESALKRELNIKDTSNILRGHGGVLDRFDSLSIIAPLLLLFIHLIK